jgi:predicted aspartyl protease
MIGPRIEIEISVPDVLAQTLLSQNLPIPAPQLGKALIDTGASNTSIDDGVARALGLQIHNQIPISTPSGQTTHNVYAARLTFPASRLQPIPLLSVAGTELANQGLIALLGRDFLGGKMLIYDGILSQVTLMD